MEWLESRLGHRWARCLLAGSVLVFPLIFGGLARSHVLPVNQGHVTNYNTYKIMSSVPVNWKSHINWTGDRWDAVPNQTHAAFIEIVSGHEFNVNKVSIDGAGGVVANMSAKHDGTLETMKFDTAENWYVGSGTPGSNEFDLRSVALHEFGHALYLEHSTVAADVMYSPSVGRGATKRTLTSNDQARMQALY